MQHLLAALAIGAPVALGFAAAPSAPHGHEVVELADPAIIESSALVVQDGFFVTTNDSGDTGRIFTVDGSGRTVGVTHWSEDPDDTEALAPGGSGSVWVGDIGDNLGRRPAVTIARVSVGRGDRTTSPTTYRLTYPDGSTDAETLVRNPVTGRLYIASKNVFGGQLYAVPERLDPTGTNRLTAIGRVLPVATDGAFFPDGRHLIVRNYTSAVVYDWPSLQPVGTVPMPHQRQGEGIAVGHDGRVYVSSEGPRSLVLEVSLPRAIESAVQPEVSAGPASPPARGASASSPDQVTDPEAHDAWPWVAGGLLGVVAVVVLLRALRPH